MRIALLTHRYPVATETFISEPVLALREAGHDVRVVADFAGGPVDDAGPLAAERPTRTLGGASRRLLRPARLLLEPLAGVRSLRRALPFARGAAGAIEGAVLALLPELTGADVALAHFGTTGARWLPAAAVAERPFAVYFHGFDATSAPAADPGLYGPLFRSSAALLTNGAFLEGRLLALGARRERLRVVPLAVPDALRAAPGPISHEAPRIVTIARLVPKKGVADAVRAFGRAAPRVDPRWTLDVVGDGPERGAVAAAAAEGGVGGRVALRGFLARGRTLDLLRGASVFVLASRTGPRGETEGTPVALLEAATLGLAVIATRHAGIPDLLPPEAGERGYLVAEGDAGALAAAIERLAKDAAERLSWGLACMRHARRRPDMATHARLLVEALTDLARAP